VVVIVGVDVNENEVHNKNEDLWRSRLEGKAWFSMERRSGFPTEDQIVIVRDHFSAAKSKVCAVQMGGGLPRYPDVLDFGFGVKENVNEQRIGREIKGKEMCTQCMIEMGAVGLVATFYGHSTTGNLASMCRHPLHAGTKKNHWKISSKSGKVGRRHA
jgi:hypothetical protein